MNNRLASFFKAIVPILQDKLESGDYREMDHVIQDLLDSIILTDSNLGASVYLPEEGKLVAQALPSAVERIAIALEQEHRGASSSHHESRRNTKE